MLPVNARRAIAIFSILFCFVSLARAQDSPQTRGTAADRYLKVVPMSRILDDTFNELGKQVPADRRVEFIGQMKKVVRADFLEKTAREAMIKTFTADELNALADFYASKNGSSAMLKFGGYMGLVMPAIQAEVQRGIQELQGTQPKQ